MSRHSHSDRFDIERCEMILVGGDQVLFNVRVERRFLIRMLLFLSLLLECWAASNVIACWLFLPLIVCVNMPGLLLSQLK
jgi:hypothetical protein